MPPRHAPSWPGVMPEMRRMLQPRTRPEAIANRWGGEVCATEQMLAAEGQRSGEVKFPRETLLKILFAIRVIMLSGSYEGARPLVQYFPRPGRQALAWVLVGALVGITLPARSHPLGNMGISHYSALRLDGSALHLLYVLDFAEIPAFVEAQKHGVAARQGSVPAASGFAQALTRQFQQGLTLLLAGRAAVLTPVRACDAVFADGAAGMVTLRVACEFTAPAPAQHSPFDIFYRDANYPQRSGWKEIILRTERPLRTLASSVPQHDRSAALSAYPEVLPGALPQVLEARATVLRDATVAAGATGGMAPAPATRAAKDAVAGSRQR